MKKIVLSLASVLLSTIACANDKDGVPILPDEPTEAQMQLVRDGAKNACDQDDENQKAQCAADYYVQHNLEEEPSCD